MNVISKVRAVERLYKVLEKDIQELRTQTGINCVENCIKCCTTSHIMATALEFYPMAYHLYQTGEADNFLEKIAQINNSGICPALSYFNTENTRQGCTQYPYRGLICRLFTYNYSTDKYGVRKLAACKTIRLAQAEELEKANHLLKLKPIGPRATDFYSRLQVIDFNEAQRLYPIGDAIRIAIEAIITNQHYRGNRAM
ncbi:YkgJ family cysteine cluster protein [Maribellus comscasis]|uniref:YkgJ family cysteine cluster protein n=1 Tax=Maribellus comscasis TaxID=2681766 RepID=A0A6I6JWH6_9BACT|nr:YkgJ family cysteine cluster protein [Maribellus comscasis]QGY47486.1 YkgJ family cysteine cluster protein [Maribellus comscasis]